MNYRCACCNQFTREEPQGSWDYEICPVCFWEDDPVQNIHPDSYSGANKVSLNEAKQNYKQYSVSEERFISAVRKPNFLEKNDDE